MAEESTTPDLVWSREMSNLDVARSAVLDEQELWRDMVRWSGGLVHEEDGLLFVAGPSRHLRVVWTERPGESLEAVGHEE